MRVHLIANQMLNGYSLQICQDYWRTYRNGSASFSTLEGHIKRICQNYEITFEELFYKLLLIKAYDTQTRCISCAQMYELYSPCELPDSRKFISWECENCQNFKKRGVIKMEDFLNTFSTLDNDCPF